MSSAHKVIAIEPVKTSLYVAEAKVYPRAVSGRFARWRWIMVALTQAFFYGMPWLQWQGRQALLFDIDAGRFYVLGLVLYPQDFIYLAALLVISALALFFFTALAGRLWCGYACPQTVYTEMFMWLERHTEGDRQARMKLDRAPWSAEKLLRKSAKHGSWVALALLTGFSFVGYFTPIRQLAASLAMLSLTGWESFWVLFYAGATYGNAGWLREQMCKYICPYARFQSALIDADSLIISYDQQRGEPRGSRARQAEFAAQGQPPGDCVDCTLCVQVCPTGIDIRKGLQNECIGCAACIDVCDQVMDKIGAPRGLIRYATENGIKQHWSARQMLARALRPRVLIYGTVLLALCIGFATSLWQRSEVQFDVLKDRNTLARLVEGGEVENVYRLQLMNRSERRLQLQIEVDGLEGLHRATSTELRLEPAAIQAQVIQLRLDAAAATQLTPGAHPIRFLVREAGSSTLLAESRASFYLPR
ncbi:cytochrome c oxidase accessory protein CcoG [Paucibacter sp. APW11]|uniref:Cytochrome c oxidase accessory protein CcoG n=1 Tax=Roseateles aquae TaxID=3077235 RepID=A0ABU3P637_9BURK|nr:cytochrome c oxidase accessory protein CcoG [Paucibacter sp. APW11]MDT8998031.1 cytochrome c oxidase accessory protein CcoG [Paucibacter sp. APW11]